MAGLQLQAAFNGRVESLRMLRELGANVDKCNNYARNFFIKRTCKILVGFAFIWLNSTLYLSVISKTYR